jgi:galactitol-specific phosphotransferase system IIB component
MEKKQMYEKVKSVHTNNVESLLAQPGVFGVGIGLNSNEKTNGDMPYAIHVHIDKTQDNANEMLRSIPTAINEVPVEVYLEFPPVLLLGNKALGKEDSKKYRPLKGGIEIYENGSKGMGTMGCVVKKDGAYYGLSNEHVLGKVGKEVKQPYSDPCCDCCCCSDIVGKISASVNNGHVDAAIFKINSDIGWKNEIVDMEGYIQGWVDVDETFLEKKVIKRGRTTGFTRGKISLINYTCLTENGQKKDQIKINKIAGEDKYIDHGDSGSITLLEENNKAKVIGLNYAGATDGSYGVANRIKEVISTLGIEFMVGKQVSNESEGIDLLAALNNLKDQLKASTDENVRLVNRLIDKHVNEVLRLVNKTRPVTVVWQRNEGPELFRQILQGEQSNMVQMQKLLNDMGHILYENGSPRLRVDLVRYQNVLLQQSARIFTGNF